MRAELHIITIIKLNGKQNTIYFQMFLFIPHVITSGIMARMFCINFVNTAFLQRNHLLIIREFEYTTYTSYIKRYLHLNLVFRLDTKLVYWNMIHSGLGSPV